MNLLSSLAFPSYFQGAELWKVFCIVFWCFVFFTIWFKLTSLCHLDVSSTEQDSGFILRRAFQNPNLCFAGFFCWSNRTGPDEATYTKSSSGRRTRHEGREVWTQTWSQLWAYLSHFQCFQVLEPGLNYRQRIPIGRCKVQSWRLTKRCLAKSMRVYPGYLGRVANSGNEMFDMDLGIPV